MLNVVVLPAPFGPMMPTISHSPSWMLTSRAAWMPPKRMERLRVSSTDIADRHLLHVAGVQVEAVAGDPALDRPDLLAEAARGRDEGDDHDDREQEDPEGRCGEGRPLPDLRLEKRDLRRREDGDRQHGEHGAVD